MQTSTRGKKKATIGFRGVYYESDVGPTKISPSSILNDHASWVHIASLLLLYVIFELYAISINAITRVVNNTSCVVTKHLSYTVSLKEKELKIRIMAHKLVVKYWMKI